MSRVRRAGWCGGVLAWRVRAQPRPSAAAGGERNRWWLVPEAGRLNLHGAAPGQKSKPLAATGVVMAMSGGPAMRPISAGMAACIASLSP